MADVETEASRRRIGQRAGRFRVLLLAQRGRVVERPPSRSSSWA
ncbi:MAG: hypothetical protein ACRDSP_11060 [Pseudonocardiaceae bacterium]